MKTSVRGAHRGLLFGLLAFCAALMLLAVTSAKVFADNVNIVDNAHVLDVAQVTDQASQLPYQVSIYTNNTFTGSNDAFDQFTTTFIGPNDSNLIVINIDTVHRHLAIVGGTQVPLSNDQYASAVQAFKDNFNNGDYTGATIAALQSLNAALTPPPPDTGNNGFPPNGQFSTGPIQLSSPDSNSNLVPLIGSVGVVVLIVIFIARLMRYTAGTRSPRSRRPTVVSGTQPLDATPFEAGALGTGIGGMADYEAGREEMERQSRERIQQQMFNNNNSINNFPSGGNIGGGAAGDFGGGNMGGGGNIGGGSSGNF
ncbi:MAG TPA: hypothetical protein VJO32_09490 [Ktedonobacteraceae bacterium]|nr:hypothetical protein [Ktedonobacteraceae bacterium]